MSEDETKEERRSRLRADVRRESDKLLKESDKLANAGLALLADSVRDAAGQLLRGLSRQANKSLKKAETDAEGSGKYGAAKRIGHFRTRLPDEDMRL